MGRTVMDEKNFRELVNRNADEFQRQHGMPVPTNAREELIRPALPHLRDVKQDLQDGKITEEELGSAVHTILEGAMAVARELGRDSLGEETVQESMRRDCPYIFWC